MYILKTAYGSVCCGSAQSDQLLIRSRGPFDVTLIGEPTGVLPLSRLVALCDERLSASRAANHEPRGALHGRDAISTCPDLTWSRAALSPA